MTDQYKIRILAIDDNSDTRYLIRNILENQYTIVEAESGKEALRILRDEDPPELILLDIMMPDMDGYEVCKAIREIPRLANIPIIFVTSLDDRVTESKGLDLGAIDFITKPFDKNIILVRIESALELHEGLSLSINDFPGLESEFDEIDPARSVLQNAEESFSDRTPVILSIDDERFFRDLIEDGLKNDYRVISCENAGEAFNYIENNLLPDLILLDISMPKTDGFEIIRQLKETKATASVPVIFLTGQNTTDDEIRGFQAGAVDFVHKPISLPVLRARIRNQLMIEWKRKQIETRMAEFEDE
jgi:PleD family two-component response regulator